jgi:hypothetical protein
LRGLDLNRRLLGYEFLNAGGIPGFPGHVVETWSTGSIVALNMFFGVAIGAASQIYVAQNCFARVQQLG